MNQRYVQALVIIGLGFASLVWSILDGGSGAFGAVVLGSAAMPLAVLLAVSGRMDENPPWRALAGGGTIGVAIALAGHAVVFAFAYAFFLGFADEAVGLLEALRVDPGITSVIDSPWTLVLIIELVVVAPVTEEFGKGVGARLVDFSDRKAAFLSGVAAGAGFAVVENVAYAAGAGFFGGAGEPIVLSRMLGAAVHPLASGLVVLGWWEWRTNNGGALALRRILTGTGVHALWNGSLVAVGIVATAFDVGDTPFEMSVTSLIYAAALGILLGAALWRLTLSVVDDTSSVRAVDPADARVLGIWTLLAASLLIPVTMVLIAFPTFLD